MSAQPVTEDIVNQRVREVFRRAGWIAAAVAALIGLFGLIFPQKALAVVALLAGIYLVVSGIMRISTAVTARGIGTGWRVLLGVIGALLVAGGVLALNNPFGTLIALAIVIGIGWIADGIGYLLAAFTLRRGGGVTWALALAGVLLLIAGILVLVVPGSALVSLFFLMSLLLLIVGVVTLLALALSRTRARA